MKKNLSLVLPMCLLASAVSLQSCSDEDFGYTKDQLSFAKNFKEAYGTIDPLQDWNAAARYAVTVTTNGASDVNIYAKGNAGYSIVGHYQNVSGTQTLYFDAIKGVNDIMVSCGSMTQTTTVGGAVSFAGGTRLAVTSGNADGTGITVAQLPAASPYDATTLNLDDDGYKELTIGQVRGYDAIVPELNIPSANPNNLDRVTTDFSFVATGEGDYVTYIIYPVWSCTSQTHSIGIYWLDNEGTKHEKLIYSFAKTTGAHTPGNACDVEVYKPLYGGDYTWQGIGSLQSKDDIASLLDGALKFRSRGFTLTVPKGLEFGMYSTSGAGTFYSEAKYNNDTPYKSHASVFTLQGKTYFAFEDWTMSSSDMDMNDFILMFDNYNPTTINKETPQWVIAYEDLGNTFDLDFNDVVIKVAHTSGESTATVYPLAAGGTLASNVYFNPQGGEKQDLGEIHYWLNGETGASGSLTPTNVSPTGLTVSTATIEEKGQSINVGSDWSMAYLTSELVSGATDIQIANMGGFELRVTPDGGSSNTQEVNKAIYAVSAPAKGETPQMICLPYYWRNEGAAGTTKSTWGWATETMPMSQAFSGWNAWVSNHAVSTDWYKYANATGTTHLGETNVTATVGGTNSIVAEDHEKADCPLTVNVAIPDGETLPTITLASYGKMATLGAQSVSMGEITYTYCDENGDVVPASDAVVILDYDFGFVRAIGGGTAYIKVSQAADNNYSSGYKIVKVVSTMIMPEVKIQKENWGSDDYTGTNKNLIIGDTWNVYGAQNSGGTYSWHSSNPSVATITDNGASGACSSVTITAVACGECDITFSVGPNNTYSAGSATVHIVVTKQDPGLTITCAESVTLEPGGSLSIGASATSTGIISYESDQSYVTVTNEGLIEVSSSAENLSTATITVRIAEYGDYAEDSKEIHVTIKESAWPASGTYTTSNLAPNDWKTGGWGNENTIDLSTDATFMELIGTATSATMHVVSTDGATSVYPNNSCFNRTNLTDGSADVVLDIAGLRSSKQIVVGSDNGTISNLTVTIRK